VVAQQLIGTFQGSLRHDPLPIDVTFDITSAGATSLTGSLILSSGGTLAGTFPGKLGPRGGFSFRYRTDGDFASFKGKLVLETNRLVGDMRFHPTGDADVRGRFELDKVVAPGPTPTPTPPPVPAAPKPGVDNTGPSNPSVLQKVSGDITITQDGAVIENVDVDGDINVQASNVTIRNFRATGIKFYDEDKYGSFRNLLIEDGEVTDPSDGTGITGGHMTVRRVEVHHMGSDAFNVHADALIEGCYVHHLGMLKGSHADAVSGSSPDGEPVLGVVIRDNNFDIPSSVDHGRARARPAYKNFRSNGVIFVGQFGTKDDPMIVEGNWLNGGNYTVNSGIDGAVIVYRNNRFGRDYNWDLRKTHSGETWEPGTWVGNVWDDTGLSA
jgi:hypothetical protein